MRSDALPFATRHSVLLACAAALLVHLLSLSRMLGSDEGGFAMVARHWLDAGPYLYGPDWVDRPPGLIALFAAAAHLGPYGVRLVAAALAVALVAAVARAAAVVGGASAARWGAWTAFAFGSSVLLQAEQLNGELAAATCVAGSVAALLCAVRVAGTRTRAALLGALAGGSAAAAVLMKQNFVDAFVFAAILLGLGLATRANRLRYRPERVLAAGLGFAAGAAPVALAALAWAARHGGVDALAYAMFGFRADAAAVMQSWSFAAPLNRLGVLALLGLASGLVLLGAHLAVRHRRRLLSTDPLAWAVAATVGVELAGIAGGENYWPHYALAVVPMVALGAGLGARRDAPGSRWTRRLVVGCALVTAVVSPAAAVTGVGDAREEYAVGRWVAASAQPDDTLVVMFTHANVVEASGLRDGYPYAWSLPARTLDPDLSLLTTSLTGSDAPTWVIRWDPPHTWGLDPGNRVDAALRSHYRPVGTVCGHPVWLLDGVQRTLVSEPSVTSCDQGMP